MRGYPGLENIKAGTNGRDRGNFIFEALNLHREKSTLEKIVPPQGLIRNTEHKIYFESNIHITSNISPVGLLLRQTKLKRTNIEYITEHAK